MLMAVAMVAAAIVTIAWFQHFSYASNLQMSRYQTAHRTIFNFPNKIKHLMKFNFAIGKLTNTIRLICAMRVSTILKKIILLMNNSHRLCSGVLNKFSGKITTKLKATNVFIKIWRVMTLCSSFTNVKWSFNNKSYKQWVDRHLIYVIFSFSEDSLRNHSFEANRILILAAAWAIKQIIRNKTMSKGSHACFWYLLESIFDRIQIDLKMYKDINLLTNV